MPTRIVLKEASPPSQLTPRSTPATARNTPSPPRNVRLPNRRHRDADPSHINVRTTFQQQTARDRTNVTSRASSRRKSVASFRSSILREISTARDGTAVEDDDVERLSSDDIRASPRLLGYFFCMVAGAVMLVSIVQYVPTAVSHTSLFLVQSYVCAFLFWFGSTLFSLGAFC
jgi:hypothetical protein